MNRRTFVNLLGASATFGLTSQNLRRASIRLQQIANRVEPTAAIVPFGSGHFGRWTTDEHGLPAYSYTCNQLVDPKAVSPTQKQWRLPNEHLHQVGNDRITAIASNFGYLQVRQDEGSPKFLNDFCPESGHYGAGIGYLSDGQHALSTYYTGVADSFERTFGEGYLRKVVRGNGYQLDQLIFAPFGDDPVLLSTTTVTNLSPQPAKLRYVEYWGCQNYQFSYRSMVEAMLLQGDEAMVRRRAFARRFEHHFQTMADGLGLLETQHFSGRTEEEAAAWQQVIDKIRKHPELGIHLPNENTRASMEDLSPPSTFLVSLHGRVDGFTSDAQSFFGDGGVSSPSYIHHELNGDLSIQGVSAAHLLDTGFSLTPGESRTVSFLYGYLPDGFTLQALAAKYSGDARTHWKASSEQWKSHAIGFTVPSEPWVEREVSWSHYCLRSNRSYDSFFREHILTQGSVYQYIKGIQGAARDPLQHALPFVFSSPDVMREVIRYTLKEVQPDGSIPFSIVGNGCPRPAAFQPGDFDLWVIWAVSEYVLATRDKDFLKEQIPRYPRAQTISSDPTVAAMVEQCYRHFSEGIGVGPHGLARLIKGDWNDAIVLGQVPAETTEEVRKFSESVLNSAMASYVLEFYAEMLRYSGHSDLAKECSEKAAAQRNAVRGEWDGGWFKRAWLGPKLGWIGEEQLWLEPQPWAIVGGAATPEQRTTLLNSVDRLVRRPSPIGAMIQSKGSPKMVSPIGTDANGGVWPSINGTLVWALALTDGAQAWDEWKKNTLAYHANVYPDLWYGIWSGPDTYNSVLARLPGQTRHADPNSPDPKERTMLDVFWTNFPVFNMHPHAWPLYSAAKLLGLEFRSSGLRFAPRLPLDEYAFSSELLGFQRTKQGFTGWYSPLDSGVWNVELDLEPEESRRITKIFVNRDPVALQRAGSVLRFGGRSQPGSRLEWSVG